MKSKILSLFLLTAILSLAIVSAANFTVSPTALKFAEPDTSKTFTITPTGLEEGETATYTISPPTILDDSDTAIVFTVSGDLTEINSTEPINISVAPNYNEISLGKSYTGSIVIKNTNTIDSTTDTLSIPVSFTSSFCENGDVKMVDKELEITKIKIDNNDGDDTEWSPLDEITIEVEVSNEGDEKISDVMVEIGLYDSNGKEIIDDMSDLDDEKIDLGSIKDGKDDTATFTFTIPADFEEGDYKLVIKAYSDDEGERDLCTSQSDDLDDTFYQQIEGVRETNEEDHIVVTNIKLSPEPAMCTERVLVIADVYNIGDEDYSDQILVTLKNSELNLDLEQVIRQDFDQGDDDSVEFEFEIPKDAKEKQYVLEFKTYYDYDEDDDDYAIISNQKFTKVITVEGNCKTSITEGESKAQISATLDPETPEAVAGEQVIVRATIRNLGNEEATYIISISGNSAWSDLVSIEPQSLTLAAGQAKDVSIVLNLDEDSAGDKEFTIKATSGDKSTEQKIALTIREESQAVSNPVIEHIKTNWFIYVIILINLILVIAIIAVIRRMVAPRPAM